MLKKTKLVSNKDLTEYLTQFANTTVNRSITVYCDNLGQNLHFTEGIAWLEGDAAEGQYNLGTFDFYNEYSPYNRASIGRMVKHKRENAHD